MLIFSNKKHLNKSSILFPTLGSCVYSASAITNFRSVSLISKADNEKLNSTIVGKPLMAQSSHRV